MSDIAELFARDPLDLSEQDLNQIIARFREARASFGNAPITSKTPPKPKQADVASLASKLEIKL